MNKNKIITAIKIISIVMLLWALADNPYSYYQILRWVVASTAGYLAYFSYEQNKNIWLCLMAIIAILFNPIAPIHLDRETWVIVDMGTAIVFFVNIFNYKK